MPVRQACRNVRLSPSAFYRTPIDRMERDREVIEALNAQVERHPRRGFWKYFKTLRRAGHGWNQGSIACIAHYD